MILTINCGSSSLKYRLYTSDLTDVLAQGIVSRIGEDGASAVDHRTGSHRLQYAKEVPDHRVALETVLTMLVDPTHGAVRDLAAIDAVGHRTVHGGDIFVDSVIITDEVVREMETCTALAPLHNPPNLLGISEGRRLMPDVPHVAVFDTAFHQSIPPHAHVYGLPYSLYTDHKIRRYGFHGTSCRYVSGQAAALLDRPLDTLRMVICHLGNGVTVDAVENGRSIDTSIGFATFSGVMMGTRPGDIDPGVIFHLHKTLKMPLSEIERLCYKDSGLLGISGVSNDMRVICDEADAGNPRCQLARDIFVYMTKKYIGAYAAALGGLDALVFTAGIGENSPQIRARICDGLAFLGVEVDAAANAHVPATGARISPPDAGVATLTVPTDEERMIALDTRRLAIAAIEDADTAPTPDTVAPSYRGTVRGADVAEARTA